MKKILITGVDGFIGYHLLSKLILKNKYNIYGVDINYTKKLKRIKNFIKNKNFSYKKLDVSNDKIFRNFLIKNNFDAIFHFASIVGVQNYIDRTIDVLNFNLKSTMTLLEVNKFKKTHIIFASTSEVFGKNSSKYWKEDSDRLTGSSNIARWSYSVSKNVCEHLYFAYFKKYKNPFTIVRFFNAYGPKQNPIYVVSKTIDLIRKNIKPLIYDSGNQSRSFTYVEDIITALIKIMFNRKTFGKSYNLGNSKELKIKNVVRIICKKMYKKNFYKNISTKKLYGKNYEDIPKRTVSSALAKKDLNWTAKTVFNIGIKKTINSND
jgi:dTDP-alpha-D-glucuronic acid decarboxylase